MKIKKIENFCGTESEVKVSGDVCWLNGCEALEEVTKHGIQQLDSKLPPSTTKLVIKESFRTHLSQFLSAN